MPEWIKNLLVAIGGGSVVLIGILTIFKQLFLKLFEMGIESSFEKHMEKYKNKLSRSTTAYEILLNKELGFYNALDPYFATLVPLVQDLVYDSDMTKEMELSFRQSHYKENLLKYLEVIPNLKNDIVLYQSYVPTQIFSECSNLVKLLQQDLEYWSTVGKIIFEQIPEAINHNKAKEISTALLFKIAQIEGIIKKRLTELSSQ
ncbi:MAG: hypothetical protein E7371_02415 [Clostridiales bacterium]|nr:hypothetical protein [Clostridiales bacterium]